MLNKKQIEVLNSIRSENPKITICYGAKRAGKTFFLILAFLAHIAMYKGQGLSFILGGSTLSALRRNVLNDVENILNRDLKPDKTNAVEIFGNKVYCFDGANSDAWKRVRGFTAAGAFLNEGTALHDTFVKEVISRCSYSGARIFIDTNPENPAHPLKTDYIDNDGQLLSNGRVNIRAFHFTLFDNDALDHEYVDSIVKATPTGMFTERDIYGRWVSPEGVVYSDFSEDLFVSRDNIANMCFLKYIAGVDWGYEHFGAIVVLGERNDGVQVITDIYTNQHKEIDYWVETAKKIQSVYGEIPFFCDSARPEHIARFRREHINAYNAKKTVIAGIEQVAKGYKTKTLLVVDDCKRFKDEIYQYVWNEKTGEPIKQMDDVQDAIRYAVYSKYINR